MGYPRLVRWQTSLYWIVSLGINKHANGVAGDCREAKPPRNLQWESFSHCWLQRCGLSTCHEFSALEGSGSRGTLETLKNPCLLPQWALCLTVAPSRSWPVATTSAGAMITKFKHWTWYCCPALSHRYVPMWTPILLPTLTSVASDLFNHALRLDNELSARPPRGRHGLWTGLKTQMGCLQIVWWNQ